MLQQLCNQLNVKIEYKTESKLMKFLGFLLFFNKKFMTNFVTTIGNTIYFPDRGESSRIMNIIIAHELMHIMDRAEANKKFPFLFELKYLFPQVLGLGMAPALLFPLSPWFALFLVFGIFLMPWNAKWRTLYEARGYATTLFANEHNYNMSPEDVILSAESLARSCTGMSYYNMISNLDKMTIKIMDMRMQLEKDQHPIFQAIQNKN